MLSQGENMMARIHSIINLLILISAVIAVAGCSSGSEPDNSAETAFQLPSELEQLRLSENGSIHAYIQIDGGTRQEMTVSGSSASIDLTVSEGAHDITIILEFLPTSGSAVTLAQASQSLVVSANGNNALNFTTSDFDFSAFDDDSDGFSNLSEMQAGSSAPVMESVSPADTSSDVASTTTVEITFDDPMKLSTLQDSFTLSGASVGDVAGTVSFDDSSFTATFTPDRNLRIYETYTATVSTAAENTADIALTSAVSWSFTIQDPPVQQISTVQSAEAAGTPILEFNTAGQGIAVWEVSGAGRSLVTSYFDGSNWSSEATLASQTTSSSMNAQLVSNGTGFALVWTQFDGANYQLYNSFHDGKGWSIAQALDSENASVGAPQMTTNGTGYAVIWTQMETGSGLSRIYARVSDEENNWGAITAIDDATSDTSSPRIASNGSDYAVIWKQGNPTGIWVRIYSGSWGASSLQRLDDPSNTDNADMHQIASNGSGYSVIWSKSSFDSSGSNIHNTTYHDSAGFGWSTPSDIDGSSLRSKIASQGSITSNGTGYAVTFGRHNGSSYDIYAVLNTNGDATWETPESLELEDGNTDGVPIIASNGNSYATLWTQYDGSSTYDLLSSIHTGSGWTGASAIEAGSAAVYSGFKLGSIGTKYIAAWTQQAGGIDHIFTNVYDGDWSPSVTQLSNASNSVATMELEYNPIGKFFVAWSETGAGVYTSSYDDISWSAQSALSTTAIGGSSNTPQLYDNGNGQILAIWRQNSANMYNLYASIHQNGDWGTPIILSEGDIALPDMYAASNGSGFAVAWSESDGITESVYASIYDGSNWSDAEQVDKSSLSGDSFLHAPFHGQGTRKVLASNGSGYMLLFIQSTETEPDDVYAVQYNGSAWGTPTVLDLAANNFDARFSIIEKLEGGGYLALWEQYDGTAERIYSSEFDGTDWQTPQLLENSGNVFDKYPIDLVSDGDSLLTVWRQSDGTQNRAYTASYSPGGSWSSPVTLDSGTSGHEVTAGPIAVHSSSGQFAVSWMESTSAIFEQLMTATYDGNAWSSAEYIDGGIVGSIVFNGLFYPVLASNGSHYALTWSRSSDGAGDGYVSVFDGTSWSTAISLESGAASVNPVQVVSNGDGFLTGWLQLGDGGAVDVMVNRYDPTTGWSGESVLDLDAINSASDMFLSGTDDGYLCAWTQAEPSGDPAVLFPWAKLQF
jgi:hypothetical protein